MKIENLNTTAKVRSSQRQTRSKSESLRVFLRALCAFAVAFIVWPVLAQPAPDKAVDPAKLQAWRDARFGMFIHWGPVSIKGTEIGWSRGTQVPIEEYDSLYKQFNPVKFDADAWAATAKSAGMKYVVLVTKHHDGFCMWDTKQTDFNIMNSPFHRDVVKEISAAFRKQGIAFGIYYSTCDWHHPDFPRTSPGGEVKREHSDLDRYDAYLRAEVKELIQNYGPLFTIWFDVPQEFSKARGQSLIDYVRTLQPDILINDRTGARGDYDTPEQRTGKFQFDRPWETCMTIGDQWAWKPNENIKSLNRCVKTLIRCAANDGNLLFNVGPTPQGEIEKPQIARLKEIGDWLAKYGQSIYGTRGGPWKVSNSVASTRRDNTIFVHVLKWNGETISLPPITRKILSSSLLTGGTVDVRQTDENVIIHIPAKDRQEIDTIVKLELDGPAIDIPIHPETWLDVTTSNVYSDLEEFEGEAAFDGNPETRWATDSGETQAWLEADYGRPMTIDGLQMNEQYDRVRSFEFQYIENGRWKTAVKGTTIGPKFEQRFPKIVASDFRLLVEDVTNGPSLCEIHLMEVRN